MFKTTSLEALNGTSTEKKINLCFIALLNSCVIVFEKGK